MADPSPETNLSALPKRDSIAPSDLYGPPFPVGAGGFTPDVGAVRYEVMIIAVRGP